MWQSVRNLLVMRLDNVGDVIMLGPALRSLKQNLPQVSITLMASSAGSLVASLLPEVDRVLTWRVLWQDLGRLAFDPGREWKLVETLKQHRFDGAIIFTSFSQSPHPAGLICALADIPLRLGESKEQDFATLTHLAPPLPDRVHQVDRNLHLVESIGMTVGDRRLKPTIPAAAISLPDSCLLDSYILPNPWASCQAITDLFAIAARQLSTLTGYPIVLTGVETDRDRAQPLLRILGDCAINLIGKTSRSDLVALVAHAQLVLTNNTSTLHIANATNTPSVVLYSGTDLESQWQPRYAPFRLLRCPTECSPCYAFTCPYNLECLDITPEMIVYAGLELIKQQKSTSQRMENR